MIILEGLREREREREVCVVNEVRKGRKEGEQCYTTDRQLGKAGESKLEG